MEGPGEKRFERVSGRRQSSCGDIRIMQRSNGQGKKGRAKKE